KPVSHPVIRGVEIPSVIELRLIARVEQHRMHAVFVRQHEIKDFELEWNAPAGAVRLNLDRAFIAAGETGTIDVDIDPDGLVLAWPNLDRHPAASGARILGHQLNGLPAGRVRRRGRTRAG